jgi:hypothetical protein
MCILSKDKVIRTDVRVGLKQLKPEPEKSPIGGDELATAQGLRPADLL